jgi:hypothetical protein
MNDVYGISVCQRSTTSRFHVRLEHCFISLAWTLNRVYRVRSDGAVTDIECPLDHDYYQAGITWSL